MNFRCQVSFNSYSKDIFKLNAVIVIIANAKKYLQSDWVRGVQYWPYLYSVFNIYTLLLNEKNQRSISVAEK